MNDSRIASLSEIIKKAQGHCNVAEQLFVVNLITEKPAPRQVVYLGRNDGDGFVGLHIQVNGSGPIINGHEGAALVAHALREVLGLNNTAKRQSTPR